MNVIPKTQHNCISTTPAPELLSVHESLRSREPGNTFIRSSPLSWCLIAAGPEDGDNSCSSLRLSVYSSGLLCANCALYFAVGAVLGVQCCALQRGAASWKSGLALARRVFASAP